MWRRVVGFVAGILTFFAGILILALLSDRSGVPRRPADAAPPGKEAPPAGEGKEAPPAGEEAPPAPEAAAPTKSAPAAAPAPPAAPPPPAGPSPHPPAPPPPALAPPQAEQEWQRQAKDTLTTSNIAYNAPETIRLDETAVVQLKLSPSLSVEELKEQITEPGKKEGASIPFSRRVEARLTGSAFTIAALGTELPREVKPGRVCEWSWAVTPTRPGTQRLFLTIDAVVTVDGKDVAEYERVFARTIKVRVTLGQRVASFVGNNWQWLWTVGLVPLGGWLLARVRRQRPGTSGPPPGS